MVVSGLLSNKRWQRWHWYWLLWWYPRFLNVPRHKNAKVRILNFFFKTIYIFSATSYHDARSWCIAYLLWWFMIMMCFCTFMLMLIVWNKICSIITIIMLYLQHHTTSIARLSVQLARLRYRNAFMIKAVEYGDANATNQTCVHHVNKILVHGMYDSRAITHNI